MCCNVLRDNFDIDLEIWLLWFLLAWEKPNLQATSRVLKRDFFKWKQLISTFPVFMGKKIGGFGYPKSTQLWWGYPSMHAYFVALPLNIWERFLMKKNEKCQELQFSKFLGYYCNTDFAQ